MKARTLRTEPEKRLRTSRHPRNNLARFSGTLAKDDLAPIIAAQGDFSRIDDDMWKANANERQLDRGLDH